MTPEKRTFPGCSEEDFEVIKGISPFSSISEEKLRKVLESAETRVYGIGEVAANESAFAKGLSVVMKGVIVAENRSDKKIIALNAFMKGEIFGAASLFKTDAQKYASVMVAKKPSRIVVVPEKAVAELIASDPAFALEFCAYLTGKIRFLNKKLTGYTSKKSVRSLLQYLEVACAENDEGNAKINISAVAEELRMSRTTLYAAAEILEQAGFIKHEGKVYTLLRI
ncbi:MAG: Crp/Fnr family transcriptional regulator [Clostridia bacterium]|nr:Crp/Fnr family transcriptional regulator [Clostridia bacterium]